MSFTVPIENRILRSWFTLLGILRGKSGKQLLLLVVVLVA